MKNKTKSRHAFLLRWHWRIGFAVMIFLIILSITGVALNHARLLGFDQIYLDAEWIMRAYNMELPPGIPPEEAEDYRGKGITLERFILDIHTGSIIGLPGKLLTDLAAFAILFLCASGLYNLRRRKKW